jgi:hypothetical protein
MSVCTISQLRVFATRPELKADDYTYLAELLKKNDLYKRRYALSLALLISPLCLLGKKKLMSRVLAQETLVKVRFLPVLNADLLN